MLKTIANRLSVYATLLSTRDKLTLIKSVFSSMIIFFMCSLTIPKTVLHEINLYLKHCFRRKYGSEEKVMALISWDKVCQPKSHGGLGILDAQTHNQALLMKHLHKFLNKVDIPWVSIIWETYNSNNIPSSKPVGSFWWKVVLKLLAVFKE